MVYEYANHLSRRGHCVTVVHSASSSVENTGSLVSILRYSYRRVTGLYTPKKWFKVDPSVRLLWVPSLAERHVPDGDAVIATAWQTAEHVANYSASKGRRFYLIQQMETWDVLEDRVHATWKAPLQKIVISEWLRDHAIAMREECTLISNGLDFQKFNIAKKSEERDPRNMMMLFHTGANKGSGDGLKALSLVHEHVPNLRVVLFGTTKRPISLPSWAEYYSCPRQELLFQLYNSASIFVAPSWTEGWALPPAEAMMCGVAVAATNIGGHPYAIHEETALVSPPRSPEQLAANILRLFRNDALRWSLAAAGHAYVRQFTWKRSTDKLESLLLQTNLEPTIQHSLSRTELNV